MKNIQNIKFLMIDSSIKGSKEFIVTYDQNGRNLKKIIFVREKAGLTKNDYIHLAKKEFNKQTDKKPKIKKSFRPASLSLKIIASCACVAAVTFAGLFTWRMLAKNGGSVKPEPTADKFTVKWVDEDGTLMDEEVYEKGQLPSYKGEYHDKTGIFKDGEEYMHFQEGWEEDINQPITEDTTFHAVYSDRLMVTTMIAEIDNAALTDWSGEVPIGFLFDGTPNHIDWDDGEAGEADKNNNYHLYTKVGTYTIKIYGNVRNIYTQPNETEQPGYTYGFDYVTSVSYGCSIDGKNSGGTLFSFGSHLSSLIVSSAVTDLEINWPWGIEEALDLKFDKNSRCRHIVSLTGEFTKFKNFVVPNTVLTIEKNALVGIELEKLQFEENSRCTYIGERALEGATMESVEFPSSVTTIDMAAFYNCDQLKSIFIPKTINYIEYLAFANCDVLKSVVFEDRDSDIYVGDEAFDANHSYDEFVLPKNMKESLHIFNKGLFEGATISNITIPEGTKRLNNFLFQNVTFSNDVNFPNSLEEIGDCAFSNASIKNVDLSNTNVKTIGGSTFEKTSNLDTVKFPKTLEIMDGRAFANSSVKTVIFPDDAKITEIEEYSFSECSNLKNISLPKSLSKLNQNAFRACESLKSISFKDLPNLHEIPSQSFADCTGLTSVEFGDNIISIGADAFNACTTLSSIKIPKNIKSIAMNAFAETGLTSVDLTDFVEPRIDKIPVIDKMELFPNTTRFTVKNEQMKNVFESADGWSDYSGKFDIA